MTQAYDIRSYAFTGTALKVKILNANKAIRYLAFYAESGDCEICIGDADFDTNSFFVDEHTWFQMSVSSIENVWYRGDATSLRVLTNGTLV
jgi:hypothetical protein